MNWPFGDLDKHGYDVIVLDRHRIAAARTEAPLEPVAPL